MERAADFMPYLEYTCIYVCVNVYKTFDNQIIVGIYGHVISVDWIYEIGMYLLTDFLETIKVNIKLWDEEVYIMMIIWMRYIVQKLTINSRIDA